MRGAHSIPTACLVLGSPPAPQDLGLGDGCEHPPITLCSHASFLSQDPVRGMQVVGTKNVGRGNHPPPPPPRSLQRGSASQGYALCEQCRVGGGGESSHLD